MEIEYFTKLRFDDLVNEIKQYIPIRFNSRLKDYIIVDKSMIGSQTIDDSKQSLYKSESSQTKEQVQQIELEVVHYIIGIIYFVSLVMYQRLL